MELMSVDKSSETSDVAAINSEIEIKTSKFFRSIECALEIAFKLAGVYVTFLLFNLLGKAMLDTDYRADTLFSVVLLPALYIIKDAHVILAPYFVKIKISQRYIESRAGILTQRNDKLGFETVENIEVVRTIGGRLLNYGTIFLYAHGSWVRLPSVINPTKIQAEIEVKLKSKFGK